MIKVALYAGVAFGALAGSSAYAQQTSTTGALEEIVVTAQRRTERLQDVPISVISKTGAELERANISNIRDLQNVTPGLNVVALGSATQVMLRGVSSVVSSGGNDQPVPLYVDGMYQPIQLGNLFELPDIERVEVLKGPQGTLFGRNSTGGAVLIQTKSPNMDRMTGSVSFSAGKYTAGGKGVETVEKGFVSGPIIADKLAFSLSFFNLDDTGYHYDIRNQERWGTIHSTQIRGKLLFRPVDWLDITLEYHSNRRRDRSAQALQPLNGNSFARRDPSDGGPPAGDSSTPIPTGTWDFVFSPGLRGGSFAADGPYTNSNEKGGSAKIVADLDWATLTSTTAFSHVYGVGSSDSDGLIPAVAFSTSYQEGKPFQQEILLASKPGRLTWLLGGYYFRDRDDTWTSTSAIAGYIKVRAKAVFGEVNFDVTDRLTAIAGVRYSDETKTQFTGRFPDIRRDPGVLGPFPEVSTIPQLGDPANWTAWTPRFSLRYKLTEDANIYATYSKGFKSGGWSIASFVEEPVEPEHITSYEAGVKVATGRYVMNLAVYHYDWTDLQMNIVATIPGGTSLITATENAASAKITGFDFDGTVQLTPEFSVSLAGTYLARAEYTSYEDASVNPIRPDLLGGNLTESVDASGFRMLRAPKLVGSLSGVYKTTVAGGDFQASANLYHSSPFKWEVLGQVKNPAYTLLNGQLSWSPPNSGAKFTLWGRNLLNDNYMTGAVTFSLVDNVRWAPPRQIGVMVGYSF